MVLSSYSFVQAVGDRLGVLHVISIHETMRQPYICRRNIRPVLLLRQEIMGEAQIKRRGTINVVHVLVAQLQAQRLDIPLKMVDLPPTYNGEDVGRFVHDVRQRHTGDLGLLLLGDAGQDLRDVDMGFRWTAHVSTLVGVTSVFEVAAAKGTPWSDAHAFSSAHGDDFALEIARCCGPTALVDGELTKAVVTGVLVCFGHNPGWEVS